MTRNANINMHRQRNLMWISFLFTVVRIRDVPVPTPFLLLNAIKEHNTSRCASLS